MSEEQAQAQFNGWAKVEIMGHQTHIGYVRTEAYGAAVLFRIDQPEFPARQYTLLKPEYVESRWTPAGAKVERPAIKGCSVLVGAGSIYRILPCTEEAARVAIEAEQMSELKLIEAPQARALEAGEPEDSECNFHREQDEEEEYPI